MHLSQRGFGFVTERSTSPRHIEKNICMSITGAWSISVSIPAINVAPTRGGVGSHEVTVCPIMQQYRRTVLPTSLDAVMIWRMTMGWRALLSGLGLVWGSVCCTGAVCSYKLRELRSNQWLCCFQRCKKIYCWASKRSWRSNLTKHMQWPRGDPHDIRLPGPLFPVRPKVVSASGVHF